MTWPSVRSTTRLTSASKRIEAHIFVRIHVFVAFMVAFMAYCLQLTL